ncbi:hypothetical protein OsI_34820 [Oryza sativa Indica Group]|uniref:DNA (cytosine-5-)-methyltransferase n=2 Tax=Oryza sativa TaxID=4530 RepID=B9G900_ORYSJ|nr:hypothetical protein OsI_34820 [Oryza sativa Indica Group]EEE51506.1 hypothetical protein OsJ_32669 [Oryza sativa Japonica Group]
MRIASSSGILMDANGKANGSAPSALVAYFLGMGFSREMVFRAIKEIGDTDSEQILELLLTYQAIGSDPSVGNSSHSACDPQILEEEDEEEDVNWDEDDTVDNFDRATYSDGSGDEDFLQEMSEKDEKIKSLVSMGFPEDEDTEFSSFGGRKKTKLIDGSKKKRERYRSRPQWNQVPFDGSHEEPMPLPNSMVGFSLPNDGLRSVHRNLPDQALGPPFFYYENVALAPKGVWTTISRFLYDIYPEFVYSKYFCAAARKRGYIHNLPIKNRSPVLPIPPKTISEAFPSTKMWWPFWDPRRQFNCLQTCVASAKHTERIRCALGRFGDALPPAVQKSVLEEFAYHLSVLRDIFPNGMNVLSLFSGIGGAEVALHRLGICMKTVVLVEISEVNMTLLRSWWDQTQTGTLIEIADVQNLTAERIELFIRRFGGFDLVIGGSPCNNLAGSNRYHRDGLEGKHSALFYHYYRILDSVKTIMASM